MNNYDYQYNDSELSSSEKLMQRASLMQQQAAIAQRIESILAGMENDNMEMQLTYEHMGVVMCIRISPKLKI